MKKITLLLVAFSMAIMTTTQVMAQKIDPESVNEQLDKHDKNVADPKKAAKSSTWFKRAKEYYEAGKAPTASLYAGLHIDSLKYTFGARKVGGKDVEINGKALTSWAFPFVEVYTEGTNIVSWKVTKEVRENLFETSIESYLKAAELDEGQKNKVDAELQKIANHFRNEGNIYISLGDYPSAADRYINADKALYAIGPEKRDAKMVYQIGYLYTMDGLRNDTPESFQKGEEYLRKAIEAGYNDIEKADESIDAESKGSSYYYIYHCAMKGPEKLTIERLKEIRDLMMEAMDEFPSNTQFMECILSMYSTHDDIATEEETLEMIELALSKDPDNISTWYSRGRIYSNMKNLDESIKSFENVIRIDPNEFNGYFYVGVFVTSKADLESDKMREKTYTKQVEYDADYATLCEEYKKAIPYFEKAYEINPDDKNNLEYLKTIYFRIREEEGMMDIYNKYNDRYNAVTGQK